MNIYIFICKFKLKIDKHTREKIVMDIFYLDYFCKIIIKIVFWNSLVYTAS